MLDVDSLTSYAAAGYARAPLSRRLPLPRAAPSAIYRALAHSRDHFLFETRERIGDDGETWSPRMSVIGLECSERIEVDGKRLVRRRGDTVLEETSDADPLALLQRLLASRRAPRIAGSPEFCGGLFGYFGFETARMIEPRLDRRPRKPKPYELPEIALLIAENAIVFDHSSRHVEIVIDLAIGGLPRSEIARRRDEGLARIDELCQRLENVDFEDEAIGPEGDRRQPNDPTYVFPQQLFEAATEKARDYIADGDIMQVVLSQRSTRQLRCEGIDYYRALTSVCGGPYSYLLTLGDARVVGVSPETLFRLRDGAVVSRPMAGTRRRGADAVEDLRLEVELRADPKENAEHMMLVDLARNDLGRVCEVGSVEVASKLVVERYSHVMHLVSTVIGRAIRQLDGVDVLRSAFPAGTLSGAPKIRALEIIDELEPCGRGVYGGAIGYLGWDGDADFAIAIRTAVLKDGVLQMQAGAGIVHDSVPRREWQETIEKGRLLTTAAALAEAIRCPARSAQFPSRRTDSADSRITANAPHDR
ncbi:anthranilate synthase component 1 [Methylosinus sp. sav-2]|uniref:anthranilate synthase component I family protein n=1 Tax=Methylosinus sp. sav-2 TaxID=2485168 RepID=UPI00068DCE55|nr:anthranilate synthase component I family protein [Methylosinus sp. sav-2]TDX61782.1 anthranilate synthase component 1 [Methylosinus sp. sav-2]